MPVKYDTPCPYCHSERRFEERMGEGKRGKEYKRYRLVCTECHAQSGWHKRKYECANTFQSDVVLMVRDEIRKDMKKYRDGRVRKIIDMQEGKE